MADLASLSFEDKLGEVFRRTLPKLSAEARQQLAALVEPQSVARRAVTCRTQMRARPFAWLMSANPPPSSLPARGRRSRARAPHRSSDRAARAAPAARAPSAPARPPSAPART